MLPFPIALCALVAACQSFAWFARFILSLILTIVYVFHMEHHISCYVLMFRYSRLLLPPRGTTVIGVWPSCTSIVHLPRKMGLCYSEFTKHFDQYTISNTNVVILADFIFHYDSLSDYCVRSLISLLLKHEMVQMTEERTHNQNHISCWLTAQ